MEPQFIFWTVWFVGAFGSWPITFAWMWRQYGDEKDLEEFIDAGMWSIAQAMLWPGLIAIAVGYVFFRILYWVCIESKADREARDVRHDDSY